MRQQHPFKILRHFLKGHPETKQASTQEGFAKMVGCSPSLIRAVEQGQTKFTPKLAKMVAAVTGVSVGWLSTQHSPDQAIPAAGGGVLSHEAVIDKFRQETARSLREAEESLMIGPMPPADSHENLIDPSVLLKRRMAFTMAKLVEDALFESLSRGDQRMMNEITRALSRGFPVVEPDSDMP